jgi:hypothetical protein
MSNYKDGDADFLEKGLQKPMSVCPIAGCDEQIFCDCHDIPKPIGVLRYSSDK